MSDVWNQPEREHVERRVHSMRRWRLAISVGALILGLVLVAAGNVLVGVVIGGLAAARLVMFSRFPVSGRRGWPNRLQAPERVWLRARARDEFVVASQVLGCRADELHAQFRGGRSIAKVAAERSIDAVQISAAIAADIRTKALDAERDGTLSHDAAQRVHNVAPGFADRLVHAHRGDFRRA
jgi:hypothetical protein